MISSCMASLEPVKMLSPDLVLVVSSDHISLPCPLALCAHAG